MTTASRFRTSRAPLRRILEHWYDREQTTLAHILGVALRGAGLTRDHPYDTSFVEKNALFAWTWERMGFVLLSAFLATLPLWYRTQVLDTTVYGLPQDEWDTLSSDAQTGYRMVVAAATLAAGMTCFLLFDVYIRLPTYWLHVINQNRERLLGTAVFPNPNFTSLTCPDALPPAEPKWCHTCNVGVSFEPLHSIANLRAWWKLRSLHIFAARTFMTGSMTQMLGFSLALACGMALGVVFTVLSGRQVTELTVFCGVLSVVLLVTSLQPFLLTMHINTEYERRDLEALASSMVVLTQRMAFVQQHTSSAAMASSGPLPTALAPPPPLPHSNSLAPPSPLLGATELQHTGTHARHPIKRGTGMQYGVSTTPGSAPHHTSTVLADHDALPLMVNPGAAAGHAGESADMIHGRLMLLHRHLTDYKNFVRDNVFRLYFIGIPVTTSTLIALCATIVTLALSVLARLFLVG